MAQHTGVCLSGGGHRASLFGLGAIRYLVDAGKGPELSAVSSVSGGSLTNAWIGLHTDLSTVTPEEFDRHATELARRVARGGTLWASWPTYLLLVAMAAPLLVAVALSIAGTAVLSMILWPVAVLLSAVVAQQRSRVARLAFERTLFRGAGLGDMHTVVDHVLCSTDLQSSEAVYFSGRFVYSWRTGFGPSDGLSAAAAAQVSAALPGAFPPVRLPVRRGPGREVAAPDAAPTHWVLTDGGVYDNMGTEWILRVSEGFDRGVKTPTPPPHGVDEVIVVNASAARGITPRGRLRLPLIGELLALLAVKDVLYDQTTAVRRRLLFFRSRAARAAPDLADVALPSAIVQIDRSPLALAESMARGRDEMGARARAVLAALEGDAEGWADDAMANKKVGTTLSRIDPERAARLQRHAYVLTMANAHVLLGYPLLEVPSLDTARGWVG